MNEHVAGLCVYAQIDGGFRARPGDGFVIRITGSFVLAWYPVRVILSFQIGVLSTPDYVAVPRRSPTMSASPRRKPSQLMQGNNRTD
jgi:hypothetical protein